MLFVARSLIRTSTLNHQCRQRFHLLSFPTPPPANGSSANKVVNMTGFQRFWFASTASPSPFENDSTQTAIGQDKMNEDINDTSVDVKSRLSIDELVKLVSEKEELLKAEQRKLEKMQDEVIRNNAEIEKMENILVIAKQEAANYAKIENQVSLLYSSSVHVLLSDLSVSFQAPLSIACCLLFCYLIWKTHFLTII
ncbi:hypothetical protein AQUCO_03200105v1 [Aquilegia coerulea]|uniref:Uncharacterized protein n=1 Tax=Aquilegia coerulea TaxID=218851 RepID=A0A2G5D061_AQUCA|nr:hypothetical protein AQUCO_03200105v1 [Aquilegia coerulea]